MCEFFIFGGIFTLIFQANFVLKYKFIAWIYTPLYRFVVYAFPFRYFLEQYFKLFMTLAIELIHIAGA